MQPWLRTGQGDEADPRLFLPKHTLQAVLFAAACLLTGGVGGFLMGAVLLNYMAFYVGDLAGSASSPFGAVILGWHPWSIVRIVGFLSLGTGLSERFWRRPGGQRGSLGRVRAWLGWGVGALLTDAVLKWALAPVWWKVIGQVVQR